MISCSRDLVLQPKITVLMPTFNSAKTLRYSLDALLTSPYICEVLIADGGSTDQTITIVDDYRPGRVKLLSRKDAGLYDGTNKLIPYISGDFVQFMNSDDIARPHYVEVALQHLLAHTCDFVFGNIRYGEKTKRARYQNLARLRGICQRMPFPHVSLIMSAVLFRRIGYFDTRFRVAADLDFINRLLLVTKHGKYVDEIAADCADDGLTSQNTQVWESMDLAVKHGRNRWQAFAMAASIAIYRTIASQLK